MLIPDNVAAHHNYVYIIHITYIIYICFSNKIVYFKI